MTRLRLTLQLIEFGLDHVVTIEVYQYFSDKQVAGGKAKRCVAQQLVFR